jgi:YjbR
MAHAKDLAAIARTLEGTTEAPHFDRTAFKVKRIYATLAANGLTANLRLAPDEQELKCLTYPQAFAPVPNAWGQKGWTTVTLAAVDLVELRAALEMAWGHGRPTGKAR